MFQLEREKSYATDWVKSLPVSSAYELARCEDNTFSKIWAQTSEWGTKSVTRQQIREVKAKQEKPKSLAGQTFSINTNPMEDDTPNVPPETSERDFARPSDPNLHKALKLVSDYPDIVELINSKLNESTLP